MGENQLPFLTRKNTRVSTSLCCCKMGEERSSNISVLSAEEQHRVAVLCIILTCSVQHVIPDLRSIFHPESNKSFFIDKTLGSLGGKEISFFKSLNVALLIVIWP